MKAVPPPSKDELWITKAGAAEMCGIKTRSFSETIQTMLGPEAVRGAGASLRFYIPAVHQADLARQIGKATGIDGEMLAASDSPALERFRLAKAKIAEKDLEEREGSHICLSVIEPLVVRSSSLLRRAGEILQRRWGAEAAEVFNNAIDESERILVAEFNARSSEKSKS